MDMRFSALIAMGMDHSNCAVIEVTAADDSVRSAVIEGITGNGDRGFLDVLGLGVTTGLVRIEAELQDWPSKDGSQDYKLISATPVLFFSCDTAKARRFKTNVEDWPPTDPACSNAS